MQELGLSEIEEIRKRLNCREGLLIDFDYGAALNGQQTASEGTHREEKQRGVSDNLRPVSGSRTVS